MKKLGLSLLWAGCAFAQDKVDFGGEFKLRDRHYEMNQAKPDNRENLEMRLRLNFKYQVNENLNLHVSPQAVKTLGAVEYTGDDETSNDAHQTSGDVSNSRVDIFEAYAEGKRESYSYKLGRQMLKYGDKVVLGHRNWNMNGQAFDALKVTKKTSENSNLDIAYAKIVNGDQAAEYDDDENFTLAYYSWKKDKNERELYYIYKNNSELAGDYDFSTFGGRIKQNFGGLAITLEEIAQTNTQDDHTASSSNLTVQQKVGDDSVLFASYSFNSYRYNQLYTNRHLHNGFMDVVGRPNLERYSLGYQTSLFGGKFRVEVLDFHKANEGKSSYAFNGSSTLSGNDDEEHLGTEVDLTYVYGMSANENLELGFSTFSPGDFFENKETSQFGYIMYTVSFGN